MRLTDTKRVIAWVRAPSRQSFHVCASGMALGASVLIASIVTEAEELSQNQRETVLKGMFHMCVEGVPAPMTQKYGALGVKRFCSCYADEIANNLTKEQFDAMVVDPKTGRSRIPPNFQRTVDNANRVCAPELSAK